MREEISPSLSLLPPTVPHSFLPPSLLSLRLMRHSQMFMTDEMEEGSDVIQALSVSVA